KVAAAPRSLPRQGKRAQRQSTRKPIVTAGLSPEERRALLAQVTYQELVTPTDYTMATFYARSFARDLRHSPHDEGDGWRFWTGAIWDSDLTHGRHVDAALATVHLLMDATDVVKIPANVLDSVAVEKKGAKTKKHLKERKQVETDVRRALRTRVRRYEDTRNLNNFVTLAGARSPLLIGIDVYDRDPWLLTCANGVLDLRIGKLRAARREDF